jgi:hypothetical protein
MSTTEIKLYDIFRKDLKLEDDRARVFAGVILETIEKEVNHKNIEFKSNFKEDLLSLKIELKGDVKDSKTDMIKWIFAFFVAQSLMILGLYATILLK